MVALALVAPGTHPAEKAAASLGPGSTPSTQLPGLLQLALIAPLQWISAGVTRSSSTSAHGLKFTRRRCRGLRLSRRDSLGSTRTSLRHQSRNMLLVLSLLCEGVAGAAGAVGRK